MIENYLREIIILQGLLDSVHNDMKVIIELLHSQYHVLYKYHVILQKLCTFFSSLRWYLSPEVLTLFIITMKIIERDLVMSGS